MPAAAPCRYAVSFLYLDFFSPCIISILPFHLFCLSLSIRLSAVVLRFVYRSYFVVVLARLLVLLAKQLQPPPLAEDAKFRKCASHKIINPTIRAARLDADSLANERLLLPTTLRLTFYYVRKRAEQRHWCCFCGSARQIAKMWCTWRQRARVLFASA